MLLLRCLSCDYSKWCLVDCCSLDVSDRPRPPFFGPSQQSLEIAKTHCFRKLETAKAFLSSATSNDSYLNEVEGLSAVQGGSDQE